MKVHFDTYGCAANQAHTEVMKGLLSRAGAEVVNSEDLADVLVLNSCIVKNPTENRIINQLKEWRKEYPDKGRVLAGCMPQAEYERAREFAPDASFVGPNNCEDITKAVRYESEGKQVEFLDEGREEKLCLPRIRKNKLIDICEIAQGCSGNCAYCQVKFAKGELKSYNPDKIVKEIKQSLKGGCKEVWVTAQDTGAYGRDIGTNLACLLEEVVNISGNFRVRVGMMNVDTVQPILGDLIEIFQSEEIYSFVHLPLQSGSDKILEKMNRKYKAEDWKEVVRKFRESIPDLNLWTDVIVGFPGETEEDFQKTKDVLKDMKPNYTNISKFGARPGTKAEEMDEKVSDRKKKERGKEITEISEKIRKEGNKKLVGEEREVLIVESGEEKKLWKGRDNSYRKFKVKSERNLLGKFVNVEATSSGLTSLKGKVIRS